MSARRVDVYCPACRHRGKCPATDDVGPWGVCTRCGEQRVPGIPPKGGSVGRPRKTIAAKLREQAASLIALADELDALG